MSGTGEKGKFDTDISQKVIEEALRSVAKRTGTDVPIEVEPSPNAPVAAGAAAAPAGGEAGGDETPAAPAAPAASAAPGVEGDKELEQLRAQLEFSQAKGRELMEKIKDTHEKMLRAVADLENFKKRAQKEKEELQKYGSEKLLKAFLPVIDNLDRALEHSQGKTPSDIQSFVQGVAMTRKLFEDTLGKHGVRPFTALGTPFDPRFHEAMQQVERADLPPNRVVAELMRGFMLNDRLIRPALVMVSRAPAQAAEAAAAPVAEQAKENAGDSGSAGTPAGGPDGSGPTPS